VGLLRGPGADQPKKLNSAAAKLARSPQPLVLTKANSHSPVHRRAYLDYVGVKRFDDDGNVNGERRFLGLYTTAAYRESAGDIPLLAGKVEEVVRRSGFPPDTHAR